MFRSPTRPRFTLTELLVAVTVFMTLMGVLLPVVATVSRDYVITRKRSELRIEALLAVEMIKKDFYATAPDQVIPAPSNAAAYQAVSLPVLRRSAGETADPRGGGDSVLWTHTIVYHLFSNPDGTTQLRRTVFENRDNSLTADERYDQLLSVLNRGDAGAAFNGQNASTRTILKQVEDLAIRVNESSVDTYSSLPGRRHVYWGSRVLGPGNHTFTFVVAGRNEQSTGYGLGLDTLTVSPTGNRLEGECLSMTSTGALCQVQDMSAFADWSNNAQVWLPATGPGGTMTATVYNDTWMKAAFAASGAEPYRTRVVEDADSGQVVVEMAGNTETWVAATQAPNAILADQGYEDATIRVLVAGGDPLLGNNILSAGMRSRVRFSANPTTGSLAIESATIMERASGCNGVPGTLRQLTFADAAVEPGVMVGAGGTSVTIPAGMSVYSDVTDCPIDPEKDYLVSFHLSDQPEQAMPTAWGGGTGQVHAFVIPGDDQAREVLADWSAVEPARIASLDKVVGVAAVFTSYPDIATYTSEVFDTRLAAPEFANMVAVASGLGPSADVRLRLRSGNEPDLSDAFGWELAADYPAAESGVDVAALARKRYVQFQAVFRSFPPYDTTARLHTFALTWPGATQGIDLSAVLATGPANGKVNLLVDGEPTPITGFTFSGISVRTFQSTRFQHAISVHSEPRNR